MTMKEQERKALEQIKKIVDGLGEGSYIATAFEGCFEIAEENIENDFGCSMKNRVEAAEADLQKTEEKLEESKRRVIFLEGCIHSDDEHIQELQAQIAVMQSHMAEMRKAKEEAEQDRAVFKSKMDVAEIEATKKDDEIIRLKAKLYDLLVK